LRRPRGRILVSSRRESAPIISERDQAGRPPYDDDAHGALEALVVSDGGLNLDASRLFGGSTRTSGTARPLSRARHVAAGSMALLVRSGERRILLDTGTGGSSPHARACQDCADAPGTRCHRTSPDDHRHFVVSHAHGTMRRRQRGSVLEWVPTFTKDSYCVLARRGEYWMNQTYADRPPFMAMSCPFGGASAGGVADSEVEVERV